MLNITLQASSRKLVGSRRRPSLTLPLILFMLVGVHTARGQNFTTIYNFEGSPDGALPFAGVIQDKTGNIYGTTSYGGAFNAGSVFKVNASGTEETLYSFTGGTDGNTPYGALTLDKFGNLYGTTYVGGSYNLGVIFKVDPTGNETVLHHFAGGDSDGCYPSGKLVGSKGAFYGTTSLCGATFQGVIFKLNKKWQLTVVHSFSGSDGANPFYGGLLKDKAGNFYGVTDYGGNLTCPGGLGCGVVYQLDQQGTLNVLYRFAGGATDGCSPLGSVVMDKSGDLFGITNGCGASNYGTVWHLSNGAESVIHHFAGAPFDGARPVAGLVRDSKGNLYGVTEDGGSTSCGGVGCGAVYRLGRDGTLKLLHSFSYSDGATPDGELFRGPSGKLFGTTYFGGSNSCGSGCGSVWSLTK